GRASIDTRAERSRQKLGTETDAERRDVPPQGRFDQPQLVVKKGGGRFFVGADRSAEHDQDVIRIEADVLEVVDAAIQIRRLISARGQHRSEDAEILECDMTNSNGALHASAAANLANDVG